MELLVGHLRVGGKCLFVRFGRLLDEADVGNQVIPDLEQ